MVFSSIPAYLDPANWQQQQNYQTGSSGTNLLPPPQQQAQVPPPPPPPPQPHGAGGAGSIRPGSMADRARMANIPMPETALKCPRCESTNTKFCYFNNYSLSQPRHFCKTCRRYWTRGGALRNVPVGGGCRRNKRSGKGNSSRSKSPANSETASGSTSSTIPSSGAQANNSILGGLQIPQLRFLSPLSHHHNLSDYGNPSDQLGLNNYGGINSTPIIGTSTDQMSFQIGSGSTNLFGGGSDGGVASLLSSGGVEQWRPQSSHFPNFLGGFDPTISQGGLIYPPNYQGSGSVEGLGSGGYVGAKLSNSSVLSQLASVKMEASNNNNNNNNLVRQFLGSVQGGNEHQWSSTSGASAWTDLSGFTSSSTSNAL